MKARGIALAALAALALGRSPLSAQGDDANLVAIAAWASQGYVRTRLPDGSFRPESYVFGLGGYWHESDRDPSIDRISFAAVKDVMQRALAAEGYYRATDRNGTRLIVVVYWGLTTPPDPADEGLIGGLEMQEQQAQLAQAQTNPSSTQGINGPNHLRPIAGDYDRNVSQAIADKAAGDSSRALEALVLKEQQTHDSIDRKNSRILGYQRPKELLEEMDEPVPQILQSLPSNILLTRELIDEIEEPRYFVVLQAYDFQAFEARKKRRLLWQARFSIRAPGRKFDRQLAAMADAASGFFGRNSGGLIHRPLPQGRVELGPLKFLEPFAPPPEPLRCLAALAPDGKRVAYLWTYGAKPRLVIAGLNPSGGMLVVVLPSPWLRPSPGVSGGPPRLAWIDSNRAALTAADGAVLVCGVDGRLVESRAPPAPPDRPSQPMADPASAGVLAVVGQKLPHRSLVPLGRDASGRRFLFSAASQSGDCRFFVYDRPTRLLFEVGRLAARP